MLLKTNRLLLAASLVICLSTTVPIAGQDVPADEWTQDAHDGQRTGYTSEEPAEPWTLAWTWNGPDEAGGTGGHFYDAPPEARTVTGGDYVYVPAGEEGLFALSKDDGLPAWNLTDAAFNATPAYDPATDMVYAAGADGKLYQITSADGTITATYDAGSPLNKSVLLVDSFAYTVTDDGQLHKVDTTDMSGVWLYEADAEIATPPAYSPSRDLVVYATNDLFVHAVKNADGSARWRVKPTPNPAGFPNEFDGYWPVIAEGHGVVFLRMRLNHDAGLWGGPGQSGMYPNSNADTRSFLEARPELKNLFALSLDSGEEAFVAAVGYGGVEALVGENPYLEVGPVPVIRVLPDGTEVAYVPFRNGQGEPPDGRWDSHLGEMVLDDETIPGLVPGELRFVQFPDSYVYITDEQTPLTMGGDSIFYAHWGASTSTQLLDRSDKRGLTYADPITSRKHPSIIRRMQSCDDFDPITHWTTCGLTLFNDGRYWPGPGWWVYWDTLDPTTSVRGAYSEGILPRYTYVSDGLVIVEGNGGELFVLRHSG